MGKRLKSSLPFLLFFVLVLAGCGAVGDEAADPPIDKSIDYPSEGVISFLQPINADTYNDSANINLYIKNDVAEQGFTQLSNGYNVDPDTPITLGVKVSPNIENGRVFLSDGGKYYKEAFLNDNGFYECEFIFNNIVDYKLHPLLVEVVYLNDSDEPVASKEKIVLATSTDFKAGDDKLVTHGLGLTIGKDLLPNVIGALLESKLPGAIINELKPADNNSTIGKEGVVYVDIDGLYKGDLVFNDTTPEGKRNLYISFEDTQFLSGGFFGWIADLFINVLNSIGLPVGIPILTNSIDLGGILGNFDDGGIMGLFLGGLELDKLLFFNLFGRPEDTDPSCSALGVGLFVAENDDEVKRDDDGYTIFPEVEEDNTKGKIDLSSIKPEGDFNFGVGLSQYNLNQVLSMLGDGLKISIPANTLPIPLCVPTLPPGHSQELEITLSSSSLVIEMPYREDPSFARLDIMDARLEYIEDFMPQWILSLDMSLKLKIDAHSDGEGGLDLNLEMAPILDLCHTHVLKDNLGIGLFDHSNFVEMMFDMIGEMMAGEGEEVLPDQPFSILIPISKFGIKPDNTAEKAGEINYESGNCFMNLAVDSIDTSSFCFISSAGSF